MDMDLTGENSAWETAGDNVVGDDPDPTGYPYNFFYIFLTLNIG